MMSFFKYSIFTIALLIPTSAHADTLFLHNGDKFSGTIINSSAPEKLTFDAAFGQNLNVPWDTIAGLYDSSGTPVPFPAQQSQEAETTTASVSNITETIEVAEAPTQNIEPKEEPEKPKIWSGRANIGASLQTGNTESNAINADAQIKAKWNKKHRTTLKAEINLEDDDGDTTEDNRMISALHDYFFAEKWFLESALSFEQDDIDQIDLRTIASLGLGHQIYEQDNLNLQYVLGPSYLREDFENSDAENSLAARWSLDYDQKIFGDALQLFHDHEFLLPADDIDAYLFDSKTGIRVPLKAGLVGTAEIDFEWDNAPEQGVTEDDTEYSLKIGYEW